MKLLTPHSMRKAKATLCLLVFFAQVMQSRADIDHLMRKIQELEAELKEDGTFATDDRVIIHDIISKTGLNGRTVIVLGRTNCHDEERYYVELDPEEFERYVLRYGKPDLSDDEVKQTWEIKRINLRKRSLQWVRSQNEEKHKLEHKLVGELKEEMQKIKDLQDTNPEVKESKMDELQRRCEPAKGYLKCQIKILFRKEYEYRISHYDEERIKNITTMYSLAFNELKKHGSTRHIYQFQAKKSGGEECQWEHLFPRTFDVCSDGMLHHSKQYERDEPLTLQNAIDGWTERTHPDNHGKMDYYNEQTGESQWDHPATEKGSINLKKVANIEQVAEVRTHRGFTKQAGTNFVIEFTEADAEKEDGTFVDRSWTLTFETMAEAQKCYHILQWSLDLDGGNPFSKRGCANSDEWYFAVELQKLCSQEE